MDKLLNFEPFVPCCCAWGHFECGGAGGALLLCGVNSWPGPGVPLPFTTLHCCCPLVCTDGMNIFLNFANSINSSLLIISLELPVAALSHLHMPPLIQSALATLSRLHAPVCQPTLAALSHLYTLRSQPALQYQVLPISQPASLGRGVDLPIHAAAAQPVSQSVPLTKSRSTRRHSFFAFGCHTSDALPHDANFF